MTDPPTTRPGDTPPATPPGTPAPAPLAPPATNLTPPIPTQRGVEYKGAPLDSERGPGLGCFRIQLVALVIAVVVTPLSVAWNWPPPVSAALLFLVILLLLLTGQTIIFLLRLVAADRRAAGRRRPLDSRTKTVGELEDAAVEAKADAAPDDAGDADHQGSTSHDEDATQHE